MAIHGDTVGFIPTLFHLKLTRMLIFLLRLTTPVLIFKEEFGDYYRLIEDYHGSRSPQIF